MSNNLYEKIANLYGNDENECKYQRDRFNRIINLYSKYFNEQDKISILSTPGRTELSGNHTDHNGGKVIAASISLDTIACASKQDELVEIYSEGFNDPFVVNLSDLKKCDSESGTTSALIRGIAAALSERGYKIGGFKCVISSDVTMGSGLSSSASVEIMIASLFNHFYNSDSIPPLLLAQIGQYSENIYFEKPCGLMDQVACATGGIVTIDFFDSDNPKIEKINFSLSDYGYKLLVLDTGGTHHNLTEDYAAIPEEMKSVAKLFDKNICSEIDFNLFIKNRNKLRGAVSDRAILRAFHFFNENKRVEQQVLALKNDDLDTFLRLVNRSGDSSYKYLQNLYSPNNVAEQPLSLALAFTGSFLESKKCGASRVHGGGFAGTIQVFLPNEFVEEYIEFMEPIFGRNSVTVLNIRPYGTFVLS